VNDTLGFVYLQQAQPDLAIPPLREAVDAEPANPSYRYRLGQAYAASGDHAAARIVLEQALASRAPFEEAEQARRLLGSLRP
jgi:Flp pilus assembly protein TadD